MAQGEVTAATAFLRSQGVIGNRAEDREAYTSAQILQMARERGFGNKIQGVSKEGNVQASKYTRVVRDDSGTLQIKTAEGTIQTTDREATVEDIGGSKQVIVVQQPQRDTKGLSPADRVIQANKQAAAAEKAKQNIIKSGERTLYTDTLVYDYTHPGSEQYAGNKQEIPLTPGAREEIFHKSIQFSPQSNEGTSRTFSEIKKERGIEEVKVDRFGEKEVSDLRKGAINAVTQPVQEATRFFSPGRQVKLIGDYVQYFKGEKTYSQLYEENTADLPALKSLTLNIALGFGISKISGVAETVGGYLGGKVIPKSIATLTPKITGIGLGVGYFGEKGFEVVLAEDNKARGEVIGKTFLEVGAFKVGSDIAKGISITGTVKAGVRATIAEFTEVRMNKKYAGQVITYKELLPALRENALSTEVKGRPIEKAFFFSRKSSSSAGVTAEEKLFLSLGESRVIPPEKTGEYILLRGTFARETDVGGQSYTRYNRLTGKQPVKALQTIEPEGGAVPTTYKNRKFSTSGEAGRVMKTSDFLKAINERRTEIIDLPERISVGRAKPGKEGFLLELESFDPTKKSALSFSQKTFFSGIVESFNAGKNLETVMPKGYSKGSSAKGFKQIGSGGSTLSAPEEVLLLEQIKPVRKGQFISISGFNKPKSSGLFILDKITIDKAFKVVRPQEESSGFRVVQILKTTSPKQQEVESGRQVLIMEPQQQKKIVVIDFDKALRKYRAFNERTASSGGINNPSKQKVFPSELRNQVFTEEKTQQYSQKASSSRYGFVLVPTIKFGSVEEFAPAQAQKPARAQDVSYEKASKLATGFGYQGKYKYAFDSKMSSQLKYELDFEQSYTNERSKSSTEETKKLLGFDYKSKKENFVEGFDVFVRTRGKFRKVNRGALDKITALSIGARITAGTSAATFKVQKSNREAKRTKDVFYERVADRFRTKVSKKGDVLFIEKNRFRINTPGELQEITFKGIAAQTKELF